MKTSTLLQVPNMLAHVSAQEQACAGRDSTMARRLRRDTGRFLGWCTAEGVDPLRPSRGDLDRYRSTFDVALSKSARWKLDWSLRAFVNAGGSLADEHGLGTGSGANEQALTEDPGLAYAVEALVDSRVSDRDRAVYRSGINKLARWAREFEVDMLALDVDDLEDFRSWVTQVGGSTGEILVIARRFIRLTHEDEVRRAVSRARASLAERDRIPGRPVTSGNRAASIRPRKTVYRDRAPDRSPAQREQSAVSLA